MTLAALDVGGKRIGIARTDEMGFMAHAVGFIERRTDKQAVADIRNFVLECSAKKLVVGLPKDLSGKIGIAADKVMRFAELLKKELPEVEIEFWDERLSSKVAERVLIEGGVSRRKRRQSIDKLAAQAILQSYLDAHKTRFSAC